MAFYESNTGVGGLLPEQWGHLIVEPVQAQSVAYQVSTVVTTPNTTFHMPVITGDPSSAFVKEGDEITADDPTAKEISTTPSKAAGLTIVSREMAQDSSPAAAGLVGQGIARSMVDTIDKAYFGNTTTNGPAGLESLTGVQAVDGGAAWADLDPFANAMSLVEAEGAQVSAFVGNAATVLALAELKQDSADSNVPLLGVDPVQPGRRQILGVPLFISKHVADDTVYGIARDRSVVVQRQGAEVTTSKDAYFSSDRLGVRGIMRVGFAFPSPQCIAKITLSAE